MLLAALSGLLLVGSLVSAHDHSGLHHHHHPDRRQLGGNWYHKHGHPAHNLFRRADSVGEDHPPVGSEEWASKYPPDKPNAAKMPSAWSDALKAAVQAGKVPDIPIATLTNGEPTYPNGFDPNEKKVCSSTYKCRIDGDTWDAPDGEFGTGFDDGPTSATGKLMKFLNDNGEGATHFLIGSNILFYPEQFKAILNASETNDLAVHTYTHPYMTTLSNEDVVAELGWTLQIIHDSTDGLLPRYWRPPYGDYDTRVRGIATEVFGLEAILWNQDTDDWSLSTGGTTEQKISNSFSTWLKGPKSPGLIVLEHELDDRSVQTFIDAYPKIKDNGWNMKSVVDCASAGSPYQVKDKPASPEESASQSETSSSSIATASASNSNQSDSSLQAGVQSTNSGPSSDLSMSWVISAGLIMLSFGIIA